MWTFPRKPLWRCSRETRSLRAGGGVRRCLRRALAVGDAAAGQVVRTQLDLHSVTQGHADVELAHLARRVGKHLLTSIEAYSKLTVAHGISNDSTDFDGLGFGHSHLLCCSIVLWPSISPIVHGKMNRAQGDVELLGGTMQMVSHLRYCS